MYIARICFMYIVYSYVQVFKFNQNIVYATKIDTKTSTVAPSPGEITVDPNTDPNKDDSSSSSSSSSSSVEEEEVPWVEGIRRWGNWEVKHTLW